MISCPRSYPPHQYPTTLPNSYQSGYRRNSFAQEYRHPLEPVNERWADGAMSNGQSSATIPRTLPQPQPRSPRSTQGPVRASSSYTTGVAVGSPGEFFTALVLRGNEAQTDPGAAGRSGQRHPSENQRPQASTFFTVGKVFTLLWPEHSSELCSVGDGPSPGPLLSRSDELAYSQTRLFVVVCEADSYCICLPILTYGGQGAGKPGLIKSTHAIVYTGRTPPQPLSQELPRPGEKPMGRPIKVDPDQQVDRLDVCSRVAFGQAHSMQHSLNVKSFGLVSRHCVPDLVEQYYAAQGRSLPPDVGIGSSVMADNDSLLYRGNSGLSLWVCSY